MPKATRWQISSQGRCYLLTAPGIMKSVGLDALVTPAQCMACYPAATPQCVDSTVSEIGRQCCGRNTHALKGVCNAAMLHTTRRACYALLTQCNGGATRFGATTKHYTVWATL